MGSVTINGSTSGAITLAAPAVAGSNTLTLPAATGTVITSGSSAALPVAAISATGTPTASTFLRGDSTWSAVSASGQLIRAPQVLTSGTSYTTPSNCTAIYVQMVGGGGNGGSTNQGGSYSGAGGGAGAYCAKYFTVTGSTAYTYAVGSGGAGRNDGTAVSGGNTTFTVGATTITAGGGGGGGNNSGVASGGGGGTATNGDINVSGATGDDGFYLSISTTNLYLRGGGASSFFGGGGPSKWSTAGTQTGVNASGYGSGGTGATGNVQTSGSGSQGVIIVWEYT